MSGGPELRIAFLGNFGVDYSSETHHAASLVALGHEVNALQESRATADQIAAAAESADVFCWIHTHGWNTPGIEKVLAHLGSRRIPTMTYHLDLWHGLRRERDMHSDPYWHIGHFFTADANMADYLNEKTPVRGHYMPAGVYGAECYLSQEDSPHANDVVFVGQRNYHPEWPYRPQLIDWLTNTYGDRFTRIAGDCASGTVRGAALNALYARSKVVVGDSLCLGFNYPHYWSDRVYETLGRGGFLIHPRVPGMEEHFTDGEHLAFYDYGNFDELKYWIDGYLDEECERDAIRLAGHQHVKERHTYAHRWSGILAALA